MVVMYLLCTQIRGCCALELLGLVRDRKGDTQGSCGMLIHPLRSFIWLQTHDLPRQAIHLLWLGSLPFPLVCQPTLSAGRYPGWTTNNHLKDSIDHWAPIGDANSRLPVILLLLIFVHRHITISISPAMSCIDTIVWFQLLADLGHGLAMGFSGWKTTDVNLSWIMKAPASPGTWPSCTSTNSNKLWLYSPLHNLKL